MKVIAEAVVEISSESCLKPSFAVFSERHLKQLDAHNLLFYEESS